MKIAKVLIVTGLISTAGLSAHAKTGELALLKEAIASLEANEAITFNSVKIDGEVARIENPVYELKMKFPLPSEDLREKIGVDSDDIELIADAFFRFTWSGDWIELTPGEDNAILIGFSESQKFTSGFEGLPEEVSGELPYQETDVTVTEMTGSYHIDKEMQTFDIFAKTADFDSSQTDDLVKIEQKQIYTDLSTRYTYPVGIDLSGSAEEFLEKLGSLDFEMVVEAATSDTIIAISLVDDESPAGEMRFQSADVAGEFTYSDRAGKLSTAISDMRMSGTTDAVPLPFEGPIGVTFGKFYQGVAFSLHEGDYPQPMSIEFGIEDVVLDKELWSLIDPTDSLLKDIEKVRMLGTADFVISADLFDLTRLIDLQAPPFAPQSVRIEEIAIEALGASAFATGDFDLTGETLAGQAKIVLNNWETLIDSLVAAEMIPSDPDVFKGVINQFSEPGDSKNEAVIDVDISDDLIKVRDTVIAPAPEL